MTYAEYGAPETLELTEQPTPKVAPGSVLIRVERSSVNPVDWKLMQGGLDPVMDVVFPVIPGWDVAGVIEEVGMDVPEFSPGDRVAAYARKDFVHGGTYAEFVSLRAADVARIPDGVDVDQAAGLPLAGLTALRTLEQLDLRGEDTLLIHAASGGVGHIATQLAVAAGATVIGTASEKNHERLRAAGATPVTYGDGLEERVRAIAPEGVTAVADFAGDVLDQSLTVLAEGGRLASILDGGFTEHGGQLIWVRPDAAKLELLLDRIAEGALSVEIDSTYALEESVAAVQRNMEGSNGKVIIDATR